MGYNRPKVLKYIKDPVTGQIESQQRVLDSHPGFATSPDTIPLTYDERVTDKRFRETAQAQIDMMNALGTAIGNGLHIPKEMMQFVQRGLPAETVRSLEVTARCPHGHDVPARSRFCGECGVLMSVRAAVEAPAPPQEDLGHLHVATLRKKCRDAGLPDRGTKDVLIGRLQAA